MNTKRKVIYGITGGIVILGALLLACISKQIPPKYRPQLIERPDESFQFLNFKVTRQSEVSFVFRSVSGKAKYYIDRLQSALANRKPFYQVGGNSDFLWITYRSEKLNGASCAQPIFKDEQDKPVFPHIVNSTYDVKTGTGLLTVVIPKSITNRWKLQLNIPGDGKGFNGGRYAVFEL